jgi:hypothetical protein
VSVLDGAYGGVLRPAGDIGAPDGRGRVGIANELVRAHNVAAAFGLGLELAQHTLNRSDTYTGICVGAWKARISQAFMMYEYSLNSTSKRLSRTMKRASSSLLATSSEPSVSLGKRGKTPPQL